MTLVALLTMTAAVAQNEKKDCCNKKAACEKQEAGCCKKQKPDCDKKMPFGAQQRTDMLAKKLVFALFAVSAAFNAS